ncbi:uncharacterized protein LOC105261215 [Felis catus]|uniref:uncharacterized protein LOC105261215 n=1 Tax=Felis catus TaxID=9685 RepID=UPI001D1A274D|nr:uncharacterized protein LOC105261215 [Felis catus]
MRSRDDARPSEPLPAGTSPRSDFREGAARRASGKCSPAAREYAELEARRPPSPACNSARPEALCLTDFWEMSFRGRTRGRMGVRRGSQHAFRSLTCSISHFSKKPGLLLLGKDIREHKLCSLGLTLLLGAFGEQRLYCTS